MGNLEKKVEVVREESSRARTAALFAQLANRYTSKITVQKNGKSADAKSVMGVASLLIEKGSELTIEAVGDDAAEALEALAEALNQGN